MVIFFHQYCATRINLTAALLSETEQTGTYGDIIDIATDISKTVVPTNQAIAIPKPIKALQNSTT